MWKLNRFSVVNHILTFSLFITHSFTLKLNNVANSNGINKGWLRVCNANSEESKSTNQQNYEIEADKCPHGSWLSESIRGDCVCVNGLWAISQNWCDEDYYVVFGKGHCFQLGKKIQKIAFLGNAQDPFQPANFITKENGHVFRRFSDEFLMPFEFSQDTNRTILRLNPEKEKHVVLEMKSRNPYEDGLYSEQKDAICLKTENNFWTEEALMIYKIKTGISSIKLLQECPDRNMLENEIWGNKPQDSTILKILPGQAIHMKSGKIIEASKECSTDCLAASSSNSNKSQTKLIRHKRQIANAEDTPDFAPLQIDRDTSDIDKDIMVNIANYRVLKQELNWLNGNIRPPTLNTQIWKMMRKIKEIFVSACPEPGVPKFLPNTMMRLFRLFYLHSKDFHPNTFIIEETEQYERIMKSLDSCLGATHVFNFTYTWVKDMENQICRKVNEEVDVAGKMVEVEKTYCWCKQDLEQVELQYSKTIDETSLILYNLTKENLTINEDLMFLMPKEDRFNGSFHDFPTETVWKMIKFAHYYCAKHFQFNPADHSAMITKLETLFNDDIIYRWTHPGMNSNKLWQVMYSSFDLKKYAYSVDHCVAGAKSISEYPEWIIRPTADSMRRRKRSLESEKLSSGSAYCLEDPWDPVYKLGVEVPPKCADLNRY